MKGFLEVFSRVFRVASDQFQEIWFFYTLGGTPPSETIRAAVMKIKEIEKAEAVFEEQVKLGSSLRKTEEGIAYYIDAKEGSQDRVAFLEGRLLWARSVEGLKRVAEVRAGKAKAYSKVEGLQAVVKSCTDTVLSLVLHASRKLPFTRDLPEGFRMVAVVVGSDGSRMLFAFASEDAAAKGLPVLQKELGQRADVEQKGALVVASRR